MGGGYEGLGRWMMLGCMIWNSQRINKMLKIWDGKRDTASNTIEIQIISGYFRRLNANKLEKPKRNGWTFRHNLSNWIKTYKNITRS